MARQKSEFVKVFGIAFEIWKALVEAVLSLGGTDDNLRRIITNATLRLALAKLIVGKVEGAFRVLVNPYDPRWTTPGANSRSCFVYANGPTRSDFPVVPRDMEEVWMEYMEVGGDTTIRQLKDAVRMRGFQLPDFAQTQCFLEQFPEEPMNGTTRIVSLCGSVQPGAYVDGVSMLSIGLLSVISGQLVASARVGFDEALAPCRILVVSRVAPIV